MSQLRCPFLSSLRPCFEANWALEAVPSVKWQIWETATNWNCNLIEMSWHKHVILGFFSQLIFPIPYTCEAEMPQVCSSSPTEFLIISQDIFSTLHRRKITVNDSSLYLQTHWMQVQMKNILTFIFKLWMTSTSSKPELCNHYTLPSFSSVSFYHLKCCW